MSTSPTPPPIPPRPKPHGIGQDPTIRMLLPVGRSGWAIAAGYAGLFSFVFIGAPFALAFGILAVREIRKSRGSDQPKHGMGRAIFGIVSGGAMTLALVLLLFLAWSN